MNRVCSPMRTCGRVGFACLIAFAAHATAAFAESATPVPPTSFASLLQVLFGLGMVLAAIAATAWLLKRLSPGQVSSSGALRVVGGVAVGPKERVVLVDVGETRLVLGVAPGHVSTLLQIPRPVEAVAQNPDPVASQFYDRLKALMDRKGVIHDEK